MVVRARRNLYIPPTTHRAVTQPLETIMSNDPSPLKYMGTQSQETVNMAAAMALAAEQAKANDTLQSGAGQVRERATTAVATLTKDDPIRAVLLAASAGALLMGLVALAARSGVRTIKRKVQG
jgi:hypothetical protein